MAQFYPAEPLQHSAAWVVLAAEHPSGKFRANASQGLMAGRGGEDRGGGCETGAWQEGLSQLTGSYRWAKGNSLAPGKAGMEFLLSLARLGCRRGVAELYWH